MKRNIRIAVCLLSALVAQPLFAELVTIRANGYLQSVDSRLDGTLSVGDNFSYIYTYETTTIDTDIDWQRGRYENAIQSGSLHIENVELTFTGGDIQVTTGDASHKYYTGIGYAPPRYW